jgi:shikimate dehydrogenase
VSPPAVSLPPTGATRLAAVIGDPVRHSLSPTIHNAAFAALGLDWVYVALPVAAGRGAEAVAAMATLGIEGLSVTMPHKVAVAGAVDRLTPVARRLGVVNCVFRHGGHLVGDSTDGDGFVRSLEVDSGISLDGRRVMVLGTGGAARAIIEAVGRAQPGELVVVSRAPERSAAAAELATRARAGQLSEVGTMDVVVNATPVGMGGGPDPSGLPVPVEALHRGQVVVDIVYQPRRTELLAAAEAAGATAVNGVGMLVHQAALAFEHWTGQPAPLAAMSAAVFPVA